MIKKYTAVKINPAFMIYMYVVLLFVYLLPFDEGFINPKALDSDESGVLITNYIFIALTVLAILAFKDNRKVNKVIFGVYLVIVGIFVVNYMFSYNASFKWLLNQIAFSFGSMVIANTILKNDNINIETIMKYMLYILLFFSIWLIVNHSGFLINAIDTGDWNSYIAQLLEFGFKKQSIGAFSLPIILGTFFLYKKTRKNYLILLLIACMPLLLGIRTLWLGIFMTFAFFAIRNPRYFYVLVPVGIMLYFVTLYNLDFSSIETFDIRILAYFNMLDIVQNHFFGVGIGGYASYVQNNAEFLMQKFFNASELYKFFPEAPESDIVSIFSTLGLFLGSVFYLIIFLPVILFWKNVRSFSQFEKFIAYYYVAFIFSGISQDQVYSLQFWIVFGLSMGLYVKLKKRFKEMKLSNENTNCC